MRKFIQITVFLGIVAIMSSCIASLHPIYDENNLAYDPGLDGRWISAKAHEALLKPLPTNETKDSAVQFEFATTEMEKKDLPGNKRLYVLKNFDKDTADFFVHMVEINKSQYLDFYIKNYEFDNDLAELCFYPVHAFCKMERTADTLKLFVFDVKHIQKLVRERKIKLATETNKGILLLTAPTEELQKFLAKYGNKPEFYDEEPEIYIRQKRD